MLKKILLSTCTAAFCAVFFTACPDSTPPTGGSCSTAAECDGVAASAGQLCVSGKCVDCGSSTECARVSYYGDTTSCNDAGRCVAPDATCPGGAGCACYANGTCNDDLNCNDNNVCEAETCSTGDVGCPCFGNGTCSSDAVCDDATICRAPPSCATAGCVANQKCEELAGAAPTCLEDCNPGFKWVTDTCVATTATCATSGGDSILADCDEQNRECVTGGTSAQCGDCKGDMEDVDGTCTAADPCIVLGCAADNRACAADSTSCTSCLEGFREPNTAGGACVVAKTCADLSCAAADCVAPANRDAQCFAGGEICDLTDICAAGEVWDRSVGACVAFSIACLSDGDSGEAYPMTTMSGKPICVAAPGFFFDAAGSLVNHACDADGDGWVRGTARENIRSSDCAVRENALCDVRQIDRLELDADGTVKEVLIKDDSILGVLPVVVELNGIIELYEPVANDDFSVRNEGGVYPVLGSYLSGGSSGFSRPLNANELNGFTKACVADSLNVFADYNTNGIPDGDEWQGMPLSEGPAWMQALVHLGYFVELVDGYYVAGTAGQPGSYRFVERARVVAEASNYALPLTSKDSTDSWRTCNRRVDSSFDASLSLPNIGMDFARFSEQLGGYAVPVFAHSSQFKCLNLVSAASSQPRQTPQQVLRSNASTLYDLNYCSIDASGGADFAVLGDGAAPTPRAPLFRCQDIATDLSNIQVAWGVARYNDYASTDGFERGCINECVDQVFLPPADRCDSWDQTGAACTASAATGKLDECSFDAGCATCTWNKLTQGWACVDNPNVDCGNCGVCTKKSSTGGTPAWACEASTLATACGPDGNSCGVCGETGAGTGVFTCTKKASACYGTRNSNQKICGTCEGSDTYLYCLSQRVLCDDDIPGTCSYDTTCATAGRREQTNWSCTQGLCESTTSTPGCSRNTNGNSCVGFPEQCDTGGSCSYSNACDNFASKTLNCTAGGCSGGTCTRSRSYTRSTTSGCSSRNTNGSSCGARACGVAGTQGLCCSSGSCSSTCGACIEPCYTCSESTPQ